MTRSPRAPAYDEPIQWSPDSVTVEQILAYCEREYARVKKIVTERFVAPFWREFTVICAM